VPATKGCRAQTVDTGAGGWLYLAPSSGYPHAADVVQHKNTVDVLPLVV